MLSVGAVCIRSRSHYEDTTLRSTNQKFRNFNPLAEIVRFCENGVLKHLDSGEETMTTDTMKSAVSDGFQTLKHLKDKYCPDGQTCNDIASLSGVILCFWFMYIAMKPIITY